MKALLFRIILLSGVIYTLNSCSTDSVESSDGDVAAATIVENYTYNASELEALDLINQYRVSIGLNVLEKINHISYKSEEHDNYMIANNVVNHDDFDSRSENIIKALGAKKVSENIAFNFNTPKAAIDAWLKSAGHRKNLEGDFTHFGISIRENPATGKKYYTNIFVKI